MTKEECEKALEEMETIYYDKDDSFSGLMCFGKSIDKIAKLINEHFDNPPLKFEELKKGMWVWDNKDCYYAQIVDARIDVFRHGFIQYVIYFDVPKYIDGDETVWASEVYFEENRFYLYEVKE